jgi:hypothetical protein
MVINFGNYQDDKKYYYKPYEEGEGYVYIFKIVEVSWGLRNFIDREREWGKRYRSFLS